MKEIYIYPKLRGKRHEKGYTMQEVAKYLGITKNSYFRKENGYVKFNLDEVYKILNLLDCKFEDIFTEPIKNQK